MVKIANLFLSNVSLIYLMKYDRSGKQPSWKARNTSKAGAIEVVNYFTKFPLFSYKYLDFLSWSEAQQLIKNKAHYKNKGLDGLNRIKYLKKLWIKIEINLLEIIYLIFILNNIFIFF
jgi:hypothetical protein